MNSIFRCRHSWLILCAGFLWASPSATATGEPHIPNCDGVRPELFNESQKPIARSALPASVFVGRLADVWMESKDSGVRIWARHNFKTGRKSFVCADLPVGVNANVSVPLVVLHDRSPLHRTGNSLWQLQLMLREGKLGLWSQKSSLLDVAQILESAASPWKPAFLSEFLDEYSLFSRADVGDFKVLSVIRYDQVKP